MNIQQALAIAEKKIKETSTSAELDTEVLLSFVLKKPKEYILSNLKLAITWRQKNKYFGLINKRRKGWPVAYLIKNKEFFGLNFFVNSDVLIPRPETEIMVEYVISQAKPGETIADVGTGSGCIAIALAKNLSNKILATDISPQAIAVARKNSEKHQVNIEFYIGNLLSPIKNEKVDIIIANLPYLGEDTVKTLTDPQNISLKFEPIIALGGSHLGLDEYIDFFKQFKDLTHQPRLIICEISSEQVKNLKHIITQTLGEKNIEIKKDLAGLDRFVIIKN